MLVRLMLSLVVFFGTATANSEELTGNTTVLAQFDAKNLKWIRIAEPLLSKEHWLLDKSDSVVIVTEYPGSISVELTTKQRLSQIGTAYGGPGFVVQISKTSMRILSAHAIR